MSQTQQNSSAASAIVAIAHTDEKHRSIERVTDLARQTIDLIGGMSRFVKPGQTVLIKPNQTVYYSADEGCTTDPLVVAAMIRLARQAGAARVQVAESSGGFMNSIEVMETTGVAAIAEREGAELVDLGRCKTQPTPIPNGRVIQSCPIPVPLLEADVIIDCPKAKNHHIQPISGALKNWVGAVNAQWRQDNHGKPDMFGKFMDIMSVIRPDLCVCDALIAGEGDGPIANLPHWCGCILASDDPVAMDVSICRLLKHDWHKLKFVPEAVSRGIGVAEPIRYLGKQIDEVAIDAWHPHHGFDYLPINFLVGEGVTLEGTVGHVKSVVDSMLRRGELAEVVWARGTPTIMIGAIEDPNFEMHLKEGPYVVFDDTALPKYKSDKRVYFVGGSPVLRHAMPELQKGLGVKTLGTTVQKLQQLQRWWMHDLKYGTPRRKAAAIAKPLGAVALAAAGVYALTKLTQRAIHSDERHGRRRGIASRTKELSQWISTA
jgi:uncharacterized protein (DUF362 family)